MSLSKSKGEYVCEMPVRIEATGAAKEKSKAMHESAADLERRLLRCVERI